MSGAKSLNDTKLEWPKSRNSKLSKVKCRKAIITNDFEVSGAVQNLEWSNVERLIFRNSKITNIKMAKDELFDYFIYELIFYYYFFTLLEHSKYLIIFQNYQIFLNFLNC